MKPIDNLKIREDNAKAHADIEIVMKDYIGKWYMFEIRISGGNIVDFVTREFIDYAKPDKK